MTGSPSRRRRPIGAIALERLAECFHPSRDFSLKSRQLSNLQIQDGAVHDRRVQRAGDLVDVHTDPPEFAAHLDQGQSVGPAELRPIVQPATAVTLPTPPALTCDQAQFCQYLLDRYLSETSPPPSDEVTALCKSAHEALAKLASKLLLANVNASSAPNCGKPSKVSMKFWLM